MKGEPRGMGLASEQPTATYCPAASWLRNLLEQQMTRDHDDKPLKPKADDQHKPAKHIEQAARLASSTETAKDPGKVLNTKD